MWYSTYCSTRMQWDMTKNSSTSLYEEILTAEEASHPIRPDMRVAFILMLCTRQK